MAHVEAETAAETRYKIGDVCRIADVQPYVLRYWESEFAALAADRSQSGPRSYSARELELIGQIKRLLYDEGYTIAGAKKRLEAELKKGVLLSTTPRWGSPSQPTPRRPRPPSPPSTPTTPAPTRQPRRSRNGSRRPRPRHLRLLRTPSRSLERRQVAKPNPSAASFLPRPLRRRRPPPPPRREEAVAELKEILAILRED